MRSNAGLPGVRRRVGQQFVEGRFIQNLCAQALGGVKF